MSHILMLGKAYCTEMGMIFVNLQRSSPIEEKRTAQMLFAHVPKNMKFGMLIR